MLINLHTHLEGRVRPDTAAELAAAAGVPAPAGGWTRALRLAGPVDLTAYLAKVAASYPLFSGPGEVRRMGREAVQDAAADGQDYLELRFGPATHVRPGFGLDQVTRAVCEGVREGSRQSGLAAGVVVAALRHHERQTNADFARVAARHSGAGVVGFDLAGDELLFPDLEPYVEAFAIARAAGLGLTCHAGEAAPASAVRDAVRLLGVRRVGHGAHLADDAAAMRWAADSGVVVEVCPTSNDFTGAIPRLAVHPAATFRAAGVRLVLGDDNPVQTGSVMSAERRVPTGLAGFTGPELTALDLTSAAVAFAEPSVRGALLSRARACGPNG